MDMMYIKLSDTLIIHKFAPYEVKLRFKSSIFVRKYLLNNPIALKNVLFLVVKLLADPKPTIDACIKFSQIFRTVQFFITPCILEWVLWLH